MARRIHATCNWPASSPSNSTRSTGGAAGPCLPRLFLLVVARARTQIKWTRCKSETRNATANMPDWDDDAGHDRGPLRWPDRMGRSGTPSGAGAGAAGENVEAEAAWRAYLKAHPSSSEAYAHLGLLEARQEHYKDAVPLYRRALALDSRVPGLRLNLGLALFKAGEMKDALQEFKPLLKSAPPSSPDRQRLAILIGMCYYGLEEYAKAAPYLKEAAASDPQNLALRLALAHSCLWSKAVPMRSGHLSRDPDAERRVGRGRYAGRRSSGRD